MLKSIIQCTDKTGVPKASCDYFDWKKGRDIRLVKNWRPISLINVDTKIASKSLAMRAKNVIPYLVNCDQTGYVKGRNIDESIRL